MNYINQDSIMLKHCLNLRNDRIMNAKSIAMPKTLISKSAEDIEDVLSVPSSDNYRGPELRHTWSIEKLHKTD